MNKRRYAISWDQHRAIDIASLALLILLLPGFANGQCKEPVSPKAKVPAGKTDAAKLAAASAVPQGKSHKAAEYAGAPGQAPVNVMMYKPPMTSVPDLSNKTLEEVKAEIAGKLVIEAAYNDNPGWIVARQFPERYSNVALCSGLELWMREPPQKLTKVPPITGMPEDRIPALLEEYHLQYGGSTPKETSAAEPGTIFDQDPKPGTPAPWGAEVIGYRAQSPPAVVSPSVSLTANPMSAKPGDTVTFVAKLQPYWPDAQYVFHFADGSPDLAGGPEISHPFADDGDYEVSVTATAGQQQAQSEPIHIAVHSTEYRVLLGWEPQHPAAGQTVTFTAQITPFNPAIEDGPYYFYFGAKVKPKPSGATYTQVFAEAGTYPVRVMARGEHGHMIESDPLELIVMQVPTRRSELPWVRLAGLAALLGLGGVGGLRWARAHFTRLVELRPERGSGSVELQQDPRNAVEAAFGFRLELPAIVPELRFEAPLIRKVVRIV